MQISTNGIHLEVDDQGRTSGEPVLLVMGLGMQLVAWPDALVRDLVGRGLRVIRVDNRDAGLSTRFDHAGVPSLVVASLRYALRRPVPSPYSLADMAHDCIGVLDALGLQRAHVVGASMGGMIAQHLVASHANRTSSATLIMTSSGARHLPPPRGEVRRLMMRRVPPGAPESAIVAHLERLWGAIGSPGYRPAQEELHQRLVRSVRRSWRPDGTARQLLAIAADAGRPALLRRIVRPVHLIHGSDDPLIPVAHAHDLQSRIAGSTLDVIPGMGHDLPVALLPRIAAGIAEAVARGVAARAAAPATEPANAG
jgi:pimeloyl-ACP methyl ester carboxylesterase